MPKVIPFFPKAWIPFLPKKFTLFQEKTFLRFRTPNSQNMPFLFIDICPPVIDILCFLLFSVLPHPLLNCRNPKNTEKVPRANTKNALRRFSGLHFFKKFTKFTNLKLENLRNRFSLNACCEPARQAGSRREAASDVTAKRQMSQPSQDEAWLTGTAREQYPGWLFPSAFLFAWNKKDRVSSSRG